MKSVSDSIVSLVQKGELKISVHGYDELSNDNLTVREILAGVQDANIIEEYPDFGKGPAILFRQRDKKGCFIHTLWGIPKGKNSPAVLITVYRPDRKRWSADYMERVK